ncbi:MAG: surface-adhesin E family protein [Elainellaceae cyanobacterium]
MPIRNAVVDGVIVKDVDSRLAVYLSDRLYFDNNSSNRRENIVSYLLLKEYATPQANKVASTMSAMVGDCVTGEAGLLQALLLDSDGGQIHDFDLRDSFRASFLAPTSLEGRMLSRACD